MACKEPYSKTLASRGDGVAIASRGRLAALAGLRVTARATHETHCRLGKLVEKRGGDKADDLLFVILVLQGVA